MNKQCRLRITLGEVEEVVKSLLVKQKLFCQDCAVGQLGTKQTLDLKKSASPTIDFTRFAYPESVIEKRQEVKIMPKSNKDSKKTIFEMINKDPVLSKILGRNGKYAVRDIVLEYVKSHAGTVVDDDWIKKTIILSI